jgi:hypothetical protein
MRAFGRAPSSIERYTDGKIEQRRPIVEKGTKEMAEERTIEKKEVVGPIKVSCRSCQNKTWHMVLSCYELSDVDVDGDVMHWWASTKYQVIKCNGCDDLSFRSEYEDMGSNHFDHEANIEVRETEEFVYPNRVVGRKLIEGLHFLPPRVKEVYIETHAATCGGQKILAGIGIRALVETICKDHETIDGSLQRRIDDLVSKGKLTKQGSEILHKIRTLGNEAAHEVKPHEERDLSLAMDVVENLLMGLYIFSVKFREKEKKEPF